MSRTIVSWTRFCEWVQGKTVVAELNVARDRHVIVFEGGAQATVFSRFDTKFGEMVIEPPTAEIMEGP